MEAERTGWKEPLDRGCDLQLREAADWLEPNPPGIQRGRKSTDRDHPGQPLRVQRGMEKRVESVTGGANEDIQPKAFFNVET